MPIKQLPPSLVQRLRVANQKKGHSPAHQKTPKDITQRQSNTERLFDRLKIIDWRRKKQARKENTYTGGFGFRVRELDVSRNFPEVGKVAIKRIHDKQTIPKINDSIKEFLNAHLDNPAKHYSLVAPTFYRLDRNHIIMQRTALPSLSEFFSGPHNVSLMTFKFQTRKSKKFYKTLQKRNGFKDVDFISAIQELHKRARDTKNTYRNFILVDYKKEQFIFMALPDIE